MSLQTQLADAGAIKVIASNIVDELTKAIAVQQAGGVYTVPDTPLVTITLTAGQQQAFLTLVASQWTDLKVLANKN